MLVARADGVETAIEKASASAALKKRLARVPRPDVERIVGEALADVNTKPQGDVLARVRAGLGDRAGAVEGLHVACQVAIADRKLAWQESRQVLEFADALGLSRSDVTQVLHTYWPPRPPRKP